MLAGVHQHTDQSKHAVECLEPNQAIRHWDQYSCGAQAGSNIPLEFPLLGKEKSQDS